LNYSSVPSKTASASPAGYADWLADLKTRIHSAQQRAALAVNRELVLLYWQIGRDILARQAAQGWGAKVIERLAHDLRTAFPDMKGFSRANLMYMRAFAEAWPDAEIVQQAVGQLPWGHNLVLLTKLKERRTAPGLCPRAIEHGWSRNVLNIHIETRLLERRARRSPTFEHSCPSRSPTWRANRSKTPTCSTFLGLGEEADEREIESCTGRHITASCWSWARALPSSAGRCTGSGRRRLLHRPAFLPPQAALLRGGRTQGRQVQARAPGQLSFYLTAVDAQVKASRTTPPSACCCARARTRWWRNTRCATNPSPWAWPNTSCSSPARRTANQPAQHRADRNRTCRVRTAGHGGLNSRTQHALNRNRTRKFQRDWLAGTGRKKVPYRTEAHSFGCVQIDWQIIRRQ
jgi:predicted nuclease of restriction endonuclease-like (RecB) superfamily